ncbi:peptidoglycan-binding protein [Micromonospora sp. NBC_01813]|uniref:peptidoglycan-binding protein n=1 Tax=Micromonospora sp. NBC_01813 TaxID=2975988 RepID=UPI002DD7E18E|nr:peptidoglycan-binding protein [Micromonospora sp. NBC_01813]WSA06690.1 peptidoglycan-binding protein [Micromonospora sp. NBC_01813]
MVFSLRVAGRRWRRPLTYGLLVVILVAGLVATSTMVGWGWPGRGAAGDADAPETEPVWVATTEVVRMDISDARELDGTLGYGTARPVRGTDGVLTWLPEQGSVVERGEPLYRVDDQPVLLFYGGTPLFRTLDTPNLVGRDVRVVADNLDALGYRIGWQPPVGTAVTVPTAPDADHDHDQDQDQDQDADQDNPPDSAQSPAPTQNADSGRQPTPAGGVVTVRTGDAVLTSELISAIRRWQRDRDAPDTGTLRPGEVAVLPGKVRVDAINTLPGDNAATDIMSVTPTEKIITVRVAVGEASGMVPDAPLTITLPDGATAPGRIAAIGTVVADPEGQPGQEPQLSVSVVPDDPAGVAALESAPVRVQFRTEVREQVLAVPVGALLALAEGGYAVQLTDGTLIAVETGLFTRGMVEVTGAGLDEGMTVVTTS